ncbi:MAG: hypothetical protein ACKVE3_04230 [Dissulfuribacterales bacterium]
MSKALRKQGAEVLSEKKYPLPVNGCHPCPAAGAVCLLGNQLMVFDEQMM